jgi:hypothetical protein
MGALNRIDLNLKSEKKPTPDKSGNRTSARTCLETGFGELPPERATGFPEIGPLPARRHFRAGYNPRYAARTISFASRFFAVSSIRTAPFCTT